MPNAIKYNVSAETLALKKGNFWIGTGDVGKGPTSSTGYYNGITPPSGGYTIYLNKVSGGPSIYTVTTEAQMVSLTNTIGAQSFTTSGQCINWFATQTDKMIFNRNYEGIVTNGLVLNVDAGFTPSYPTTETPWYDVSSGGNNGTLTNGPTFNSSNGGSIVFDGVDDRVLISNSGYDVGVNFSIQTWVKITRWGGGPNWNRGSIVTNSYTYSTDKGFWVACTRQAGPSQNYVETPGLETFFLSIGADQYCVSPAPGSLSGYTNSWFNIGIRVNGTNLLKCYINGVEPLSYGCQTNGPSIISYNTAPFSLADRNNGSEPLSGSIALFSMYSRALSDSEFLQNYNAQKGRFGL
jgi:hypothetical protein